MWKRGSGVVGGSLGVGAGRVGKGGGGTLGEGRGGGGRGRGGGLGQEEAPVVGADTGDAGGTRRRLLQTLSLSAEKHSHAAV